MGVAGSRGQHDLRTGRLQADLSRRLFPRTTGGEYYGICAERSLRRASLTEVGHGFSNYFWPGA
jgi:hypothetical protein